MSYNDVQRAFWDGSIHQADIQTLRESLNLVIQQSGPGEPRATEFANTIRSLISERENQTRHQLAGKQAQDHHGEIKIRIEQVEDNTSKTHQEITEAKTQIIALKTELREKAIEIKIILKAIHRIDLWILTVSILAFLAAAIAAADVFVKWFPNKPSAAASEPPPPEPAHNTNK